MAINFRNTYTSSAPLATYRVVFGVMMLISVFRFFYYGWIDSLYIQPTYFFSYYGFEWVKPLGEYTYFLFILAGISAIGIILGKYFRLNIILFFLSFTYIQLMDKTNYLNHYYFISLVAFLMIFLPMNVNYSLDARNPTIRKGEVPTWTINSIKILVGVVYFYAGLCKLNSDWLIDAMPLKIWLPSKHYIPLIGGLMDKEYMPYLFSWAGAIFDLSIPFLLLSKKTRGWAFMGVVVFHVLTWILFPIGMFPFIMIGGAFIYFSPKWHENLWQKIELISRLNFSYFRTEHAVYQGSIISRFIVTLLLIFHLIFPWRYLLYPGELFWTEEGYRFSWRVMLMEKTGYAIFKIKDTKTNQVFVVDNLDFLTPTQEKQMAFQPDFILEFAHYLADYYQENKNVHQPQVFVETFVALNGRSPQKMIDEKVDLNNEEDSFRPKKWILPFKGNIKGL
ncbi:MAG: HTTM domain-containing protein [Flavobacteriales bacterium]|nr:MAG: HTTM domain-containing protein [Flavobacteriales bacterium]